MRAVNMTITRLLASLASSVFACPLLLFFPEVPLFAELDEYFS